MNDRLTKLKKRETQLKARIASAEARINTRLRKNETRRKILVGAYFINQYEQQGKMNALIKKMDQFLTRDNDRKLFNLPPLQNKITKK